MKTVNFIEGYVGLYSITEEYHVYSHYKNKQLKPQIMNGYFCYRLHKKGVAKTKSLHRILAESFIERVDGKNHVNHIDGNKCNNNIHNLEWCTVSENTKHAWGNGLIDRENINLKNAFNKNRVSHHRSNNLRKLTLNDCNWIESNYVKGSKGLFSAKEIGIKYGVTKHLIYKVVSGKYNFKKELGF